METRVSLDMLNQYSVSVVTQKYMEIDGETVPVGQPHRKAYSNSVQGRSEVEQELEPSQVNAIFAIWGDTALVEENKL